MRAREVSEKSVRQGGRLALAAVLAAVWAGAAVAEERQVGEESPIAVAVLPSVGWPSTETDVLGLRFGLLASQNANVSLLDLNGLAAFTGGEQLGLQVSGVYNRIGEGGGVLQVGALANECLRDFVGGQVSALYNRAGGDVSGASVASLNMASSLNGLQVGLVNRVKTLEGLQIGLVNYAEEAEGLQIGLINVMRDGKYPVLPAINFGF